MRANKRESAATLVSRFEAEDIVDAVAVATAQSQARKHDMK